MDVAARKARVAHVHVVNEAIALYHHWHLQWVTLKPRYPRRTTQSPMFGLPNATIFESVIASRSLS